MTFIYKDSDGNKWKISVRNWYRNKITSQKKLEEFKQKSADEKRKLGHESWANAIEKQTMMDFFKTSGIVSKKERIV